MLTDSPLVKCLSQTLTALHIIVDYFHLVLWLVAHTEWTMQCCSLCHVLNSSVTSYILWSWQLSGVVLMWIELWIIIVWL